MTKIILASKSEGRKKVLENLGVKFTVMPADIDERKVTASSPFLLVQKLAKLKAIKVTKNLGLRTKNRKQNTNYQIPNTATTIIIAADSVAIIGKKQVKDKNLRSKLAKYFLGKYYVLGKPTSKSEAVTFLTTLSNNIHYFITGLYINNEKGKLIHKSITKTKLWFNKLTKEQIKNYVNKAPVLTYAGSYQIEKGSPGEKFVKKIKGSYSNVMGLPVEKLSFLFDEGPTLKRVGP